MGRQRKSTIMKLIHGTYRKDRAVKDVPETQVYEISVPAFVLPEALGYFESIATHANCMKILMPIDCFKIGILANDMLHYEKITRSVLNSYTVPGEKGDLKRNPLLLHENQLKDSINISGKAYGFDPLSRIGLPIEVEEAIKTQKESRPGTGTAFEDRWGKI